MLVDLHFAPAHASLGPIDSRRDVAVYGLLKQALRDLGIGLGLAATELGAVVFAQRRIAAQVH
jgi:hypothetical protein